MICDDLSAARADQPAPLRLATWPQRTLAYLVDLHATVLCLLLAYIGSTVLPERAGARGAWWAGVVLYGGCGAVVIYNRCWRSGRTGQSWGRQVVGISLVDQVDRRPPGVAMTVARELMHFSETALLGLGLLWPLWDPQRQALADKVARTVVVDRRTPSHAA